MTKAISRVSGLAALLVATGVATPAMAQDATAGAAVFKRCAVCHTAKPGPHSSMGPNLSGTVGRRAGSSPGFAYSKSMVNSKIVWDTAALDAFLKRPQAAVPGNRMAFAGIADAKQRADLIAYLRTLGR